jgi:alpha-aminoadipic semialdehyde synthase
VGIIGIRKEDKSRWERRAPVDPSTVAALVRDLGMEVLVEHSAVRVFTDDQYRQAGARLTDDVSRADVILGVKEVPVRKLAAGRTYVFFSHTIKGQKHNMPMLARLMQLKCSLLDYERIVDSKGRRLVFFGYHAGLAGMIDTLWALGYRLNREGVATPFVKVLKAHQYDDLAHAMSCIGDVGNALRRVGLPPRLVPLVVGFTGSGNVSQGAQHVLSNLPVTEVGAANLESLHAKGKASPHTIYKVVFNEPDIAVRKGGGEFHFKEYYDHPTRYEGTFDKYLPFVSVLVNGIYWTPKYPRIVTREQVKSLHAQRKLRLRVVGDISCDIEGSVELTTQATNQEQPLLVYNPENDTTVLDSDAPGIAVLAVDNLPCELPADSTRHFGRSLRPYLAALAALDRSKPFAELSLPPELAPALILWNGELTPAYQYLSQYL